MTVAQLDAAAATNCECPAAGWCERHQCHKAARWHWLCRNRTDWFAEYEAGRGPRLSGGKDAPPAVFEQPGAFAAPPAPPPATDAPATAEALPCLHRGASTREVACQLCGMVGRLAPVYACAKHGEVTIGRYKSGRQEPTCLGCADRLEPG